MASFRQDMPPEGGYGVIDVARKHAKRYVSNKALLATFIGISLYGYFDFKNKRRQFAMGKNETYNTLVALEPFLAAENDRAYLKQLHENLEEEKNLMKNVPGWVPGTLFGEPFFKTIPKDRLPPTPLMTFYAHRPSDDIFQNVYPERTLV